MSAPVLGALFLVMTIGQQDVASTCLVGTLPTRHQPADYRDATLSLTSGTASYTLPADTVSILDHSIRTGTGTSQSDLTITRMNLGEYAGISARTHRADRSRFTSNVCAIPH